MGGQISGFLNRAGNQNQQSQPNNQNPGKQVFNL